MAGTNLERLKSGYRRWHDSKGHDQDVWLDLLGDDVHIHVSGADEEVLAFARAGRSKAEAAAYLSAIVKDWTMVHYTPQTFVADGDTIAMFGRCGWRNKATGKVADVPIAHLWRFRDGKAVELTEIFDTAAAVAAATTDA